MCGSIHEKMPGVKQSRDESDMEEVEDESDMEHSSEVDFFGASDGSDSDESSELDEQECDDRRLVYATDVIELEKQFATLREQLYGERLSEVDHRLLSVRSGDSAEYQSPLDQLKEAYKVRLEVSNVTKLFKKQCIETNYQAEVFSANQNYENEKRLLICSIGEDVKERIRKLQEDRNNVSFTTQVLAEESSRRSPRTPTEDCHERRRGSKPVLVEGPYIVYRLRDEDILEDWTLIRKAVQANKQRKNKSQYMDMIRII